MRKWIVLVWLVAASAALGQWANDNAADLLGEAYVRTLYPGMRLANSFGLAGPTGLPTGDTWTTNGFTVGAITMAGVRRTTWPAGGVFAEAMNQGVATTNRPSFAEVTVGGISATQRLSQASIAFNWGNHASAGYLLNFSSMTTNHVTAAGGVTTNNATYLATVTAAAAAVATNTPAYLEAVSKSGTAVQPNHTGDVAITGMVTAGSYSATITPTPLSYATNLTISAADGMEQRITEITGPMDIVFPAGVTNLLTRIFLTIPPTGTNVVSLIAGPEYTFITPLVSTNWVGTNAYTHVWYVSEHGTTNSTAVVARGSVQ